MKNPARSIFLIVAFACLLVRAQADTFDGEVDLDLRNHMTSAGHSYPSVYSVDVLTNVDFSSNVHAVIDARRAYNRNLIQQADAEFDLKGGIARAGLIRIPFGIYDTRETYASGLINYPIVRGDYEIDSVDWGVPGAMWTGGSPKIQIEAAGFNGVASGDWNDRAYAGGGAIRAQTYVGDALILGASRWDGYLSDDDTYNDRQVTQMNGVDWRYTHPQILVRGEYLRGILSGDHMWGWYNDVYYRIPKYGRWTAVGRLEQYKPEPDEHIGRQVTAGMRYVAGPGWNVSVNWFCNNGSDYYHDHWNASTRHAGDWCFQVYRVVPF